MFNDNKKISTIKNWKKNFFKGFSIISKSEKIPKRNILRKKIFAKWLLLKNNKLAIIKKPPVIGTKSLEVKDLWTNCFLSIKKFCFKKKLFKKKIVKVYIVVIKMKFTN